MVLMETLDGTVWHKQQIKAGLLADESGFTPGFILSKVF